MGSKFILMRYFLKIDRSQKIKLLFISLIILILISSPTFGSSFTVSNEIQSISNKYEFDSHIVISRNVFDDQFQDTTDVLLQQLNNDNYLTLPVLRFSYFITNDTGSYEFTFIGLSDDYFSSLGFDNGDFYSSEDTIKGTYLVDFQTISFAQSLDILKYSSLMELSQAYDSIYPSPINQRSSFQQIYTSYSNLVELINSLQIDPSSLSLQVSVTYKNAWRKNKNPEQISKYIQNQERNIFDDLLTIGFESTDFSINSILVQELSNAEHQYLDEIILIQIFSIPNVIISIFILGLLGLNEASIVSKYTKILKTRGLSKKEIQVLTFLDLFIVDMIAVLLATLLSLMMVFVLTLFWSVFFLLIGNFLLIILVKNTLRIYQIINQTEDEISEPPDDNQIRNVFQKLQNKKLFVLMFFLLGLVLLNELTFIGFASIVEFNELASGISLISSGLLIVSFLLFMGNQLSQGDQKSNDANLKMTGLLDKLFKYGHSKLKTQNIIAALLMTLVVFFLIINTSGHYWSFNGPQQNNFSDISITRVSYSETFDYSKVENIGNLDGVDQVLTYTRGYGSTVSSSDIVNFNLYSINAEFYTNQENFGWDHFYSKVDGENPFSQMSNSTAIVNLEFAKQSNVEVGDTIDVEIVFSIGDPENRQAHVIEELEILGIVDRIPISSSYSSSVEPLIIMDEQIQFNIQKQRNITSGVHGLVVDLSEEMENQTDYYTQQVVNLVDLSIDELVIEEKQDLSSSSIFGFNQFIALNLVFTLVIFPVVNYFLSTDLLRTMKSELKQLLTRGYSTRKLLRDYLREVYISNLLPIMYGLIMGSILGIKFMKSYLPVLLLKSVNEIHYSILGQNITLIFGIIIMNLLTIPLLARKFTIIEHNMKEEGNKKVEVNNYD